MTAPVVHRTAKIKPTVPDGAWSVTVCMAWSDGPSRRIDTPSGWVIGNYMPGNDAVGPSWEVNDISVWPHPDFWFPLPEVPE